MVSENWINILVAYAGKDKQSVKSLCIKEGITIAAAIEKSGLLSLYPEIDLINMKVGIFSKPASLQDVVADGDRIEIYRPLMIDPKVARAKRVNASRREKRWTRKTPQKA